MITIAMNDASPARDPAVAWRVIGGEAVLVSPVTGKVHTLNPVGSRIWQLIDGTRGLVELTATIRDEFDVSPETAANDCQSFVSELRQRGLIA